MLWVFMNCVCKLQISVEGVVAVEVRNRASGRIYFIVKFGGNRV